MNYSSHPRRIAATLALAPGKLGSTHEIEVITAILAHSAIVYSMIISTGFFPSFGKRFHSASKRASSPPPHESANTT